MREAKTLAASQNPEPERQRGTEGEREEKAGTKEVVPLSGALRPPGAAWELSKKGRLIVVICGSHWGIMAIIELTSIERSLLELKAMPRAHSGNHNGNLMHIGNRSAVKYVWELA